MDEKRKGELAILILKHKLRQKGLRLTPNLKREIGNEAKSIGVDVGEAVEFVEIIIRELVEESFAK